MIITVIAVRMVQVTVDQVIDVITVRYSFVPASRTVNVIRIVTATRVGGCASVRIGLADF